MEENIRQLRQKDDDIRDALTKMESSEDVDIDDVIQPSAPLYKQYVLRVTWVFCCLFGSWLPIVLKHLDYVI